MRFEDLERLTDAEEFFAALEVPFDAAALAPIRLAVLMRFGSELHAIAARQRASDAHRLAAARAALEGAYDALRRPAAPGLHRGPLVRLGRPARG
jgi:hypothetical protein